MKVVVVHDREGAIISLTESKVGAARQGYSKPIAREGQIVAELDVPPEHAYLSLLGIAQRLRIDVQAAKPRFISR